LIKQKAISLL